jgi:hypothetical protein
MIARSLLALALTGLLPPSVAAAAPADDLQSLLLAYDHAPDRKTLEAAAPDTVPALLALRADTERPHIVRLRAIDALSLFPTRVVRDELYRLLADPTSPMMARHKAAMGLLHGFGDRVVPAMLPFLDDVDPALRLTVAEGLIARGGAAGRREVRARLAEEKVPAIAEAMRALLAPPRALGTAAIR